MRKRKERVVFCIVILIFVSGIGIWLLDSQKSSTAEDSREKQVAEATSPSNLEYDSEDLALSDAPQEKADSAPRLERVLIRSLEPRSEEFDHPHTLGVWLGTLDPSPSEWNARSIEERGSLQLQLTTPDGEMHILEFDRYTSVAPRKGTYSGSSSASPASQAIFSYVNDAIVATVRLPDRQIAWEIRNRGDGVQLFEKVDLSLLKSCKICRHE